ncbi:hypothetical protein KS4_33230 [Poriferisphaera corsica]|uniref:Uncharacterized protein n=1 Tax=Poriferisphaera corsica TaxID=2528020 RepID=A0A517YYD3_9BACT|nr:hypothetical protein KS4_33230 [Poriferisphaera corsica]
MKQFKHKYYESKKKIAVKISRKGRGRTVIEVENKFDWV